MLLDALLLSWSPWEWWFCKSISPIKAVCIRYNLSAFVYAVTGSSYNESLGLLPLSWERGRNWRCEKYDSYRWGIRKAFRIWFQGKWQRMKEVGQPRQGQGGWSTLPEKRTFSGAVLPGYHKPKTKQICWAGFKKAALIHSLGMKFIRQSL